MKNKKVIFLPGYYYLSIPLFSEIVKNKADSTFQDIFFHTDDPLMYSINDQYKKTLEIKNIFSKFISISNSDLEILKLYYGFSFLKKIIYIIIFVKNLRKIRDRILKKLDEISPDLIFSTGGNVICSICNSWAEKHKVPFINIQPAFLEFNKKRGLLNFKYRLLNQIFKFFIGTPINSENHLFGDGFKGNHLFVWSDSIKQKYNNSRLAARTIVTGNPMHDIYFKTMNTKVDWEKIGCNPIYDRKIVTICPQTLDRFNHIITKKDADEINNIYYRMIQNFPEIFFIIKTHPIQDNDFNFYNDFFSGIKNNNYYISKDADLISAIKISDLQVSFSSVTSFDAIMLNVPVLLIKPDLLEIPEYLNKNIVLVANDETESIRQVEYGLNKEYKEIFSLKREKYLKEFGLFDGKSTKRVISEIEKILLNN